MNKANHMFELILDDWAVYHHPRLHMSDTIISILEGHVIAFLLGPFRMFVNLDIYLSVPILASSIRTTCNLWSHLSDN